VACGLLPETPSPPPAHVKGELLQNIVRKKENDVLE